MHPRTWLFVWCLLLSKTISHPFLISALPRLPTRHGGEHVPVNETDLSQYSDISYLRYDYDSTAPVDPKEGISRHGGLMLFHGLVMLVNYMLLLPMIIVLRDNRHRLSWVFTMAFWALNLLGWSTASAYRRRTPDLYPGSTHGKTGATLLLVSFLVTAVDFVPIILQKSSALRRFRLTGLDKLVQRARTVVTFNSQNAFPAGELEYLPVAQSTDKDDQYLFSTPESLDRNDSALDEIDILNSTRTLQGDHMSTSMTNTVPWGKGGHRHIIRHSLGSDHSTLHNESPTLSKPERHATLSRRIKNAGRFFLMVLKRSLIPYAWGQALSGFCIYFGLGHSHYVTGMLAHFIKGSIFWWYGIMTFGRYLGAWRRWGWAWNSLPDDSGGPLWSASFVESLIIFLYGFSQQFMERLGAHPGDPYSAKDVEHISISVMFWAGGLVGMAIESPTIRRWLLGEQSTGHPRSRGKRSSGSPGFDTETRADSTASNPLPAVVVGITGVAMSAHHQTYRFQVQIHALWGYLLLGFAICRCLTCFFEWVRPERRMSVLPGMPPTELIGSIFLGAGGIAFICSDEEITLWAMRTHRDDVMMFLNLSIAVTCVAYVWCTFVLTIGGKTRPPSRRL